MDVVVSRPSQRRDAAIDSQAGAGAWKPESLSATRITEVLPEDYPQTGGGLSRAKPSWMRYG